MEQYNERDTKQERLKQLIKIREKINNGEFSYRETENYSGADRLIHKKSYLLIDKKTEFTHKFDFLVIGSVSEKGNPEIIVGDNDCRTTEWHNMTINLLNEEFLATLENMFLQDIGDHAFCNRFSLLVKLYMLEIEKW